MRRVPFGELTSRIMEDEGEPQTEDSSFWETLLEKSNIRGASADQAMADARNYRDLEAIVKALDNLETIASLVVLSAEYVPLWKCAFFEANHAIGCLLRTANFGTMLATRLNPPKKACSLC